VKLIESDATTPTDREKAIRCKQGWRLAYAEEAFYEGRRGLANYMAAGWHDTQHLLNVIDELRDMLAKQAEVQREE